MDEESGLIDTAAVFTQAGKIAAEGDKLSADTTVDVIYPVGKVAINNFFHEVAFHGKVEIDSGRSKERPNVVFIADGETTQVVAQEGSNLLDGTPLYLIITDGGVAINDLGEVAFHGQPDRSTRAVFTQFGVVAKVGDTLLDGSTLEYINQNGGVAINYFGEVAFHGKTGNVTAVFIADGETTQVVAKVGDILLDGNSLDGISLGVAINFFGEVAFHGRTDDSKAVFTQNGVVAKVGDFLDDASTLNDIWTDGGVAITPYGPEVAFHGQTGTADAVTDAVLVGQAPVADGEESSGE